MLVEKTVKDFVAAVASKEPAPGGGSVSALASSLGAALTSMVGNLTIGRKSYNALEDNQKAQLDTNFEKIIKHVERLNELIDEDTTAFNDYMDAMKLPKETEEEKAARKAAMEAALKKAMEVPLDAAKESLEVLKLQKVFADYGNPNAITDVGVGALLACAGLEGALFNVLINLGGISDAAYVGEFRKQCDVILKEGKDLKEETLKIVYSKLI
ncbi:cyclodeaminase/cyclohydrolase family protein [Proteiniborus sp. MB09-C3]|uniref:cyclodeaminase/cyclohydrolase family protein n=1 Tax=Proteiniborus sp. MB09-C3 TaxID=3050072 RepID=UPI00255477D3|nr:cyclodeaminase/cyclohydrolase family protein [Proteiniborus sp. MB09-C3]WIV12567.1 cyclodeaminase/cyclohydrolase family protein [Proteiniborus sp. MB09-C3]